ALVGVDDDVDVGVLPEAAFHHATEHILQDAHHGDAVDVLEILEFAEGLDEVDGAHYRSVERDGCFGCFDFGEGYHGGFLVRFGQAALDLGGMLYAQGDGLLVHPVQEAAQSAAIHEVQIDQAAHVLVVLTHDLERATDAGTAELDLQ